MQWLHKNWRGGGGQKLPQTATMIDDRQLQEAMALTTDIIACIDDAVGNLTAALKDLGRTAVVFNDDRGDYLGDFNMLCRSFGPTTIGRLASDWTSWSQTPTTRSLFSSVRVCAPSSENLLPHLEAGARRGTTLP